MLLAERHGRTLAAKVGQSAFLLTNSTPPAVSSTSSSTSRHILAWVSGQHYSTPLTPSPPLASPGGRMEKKVSDAQRAASLRYRERNKAELQRKAREHMDKRRAQLKQSGDAWAAYTEKAREESARYRQKHAEDLALNQCARRAKYAYFNVFLLTHPSEFRSRATIAKRGFAAWHEGYLKRHPPAPQLQRKDLPEWPSDSEQGNDADAEPVIPPPPPDSASYEERLNFFLDYQDPTTAPDYVPKPGQEPFFQRGKRRWD
ncbi:hypothetical protein B0H16DRAFT_1467520 [Mycena metata]|uniref:Uncharacterized protein n=1 Tax=Mycena metata TaxID=1033252 RepID=A0AAD7I4A3_9AGAR|nr:hypothetical protein B0H16DRAFT_1467520 [Mycena metata]